MPFYDFHCRDCGQEFELRLSMTELEEGGYKCPSCGAGDPERRYKPFGVLVKGAAPPACPSRRNRSCPHGGGCACGC